MKKFLILWITGIWCFASNDLESKVKEAMIDSCIQEVKKTKTNYLDNEIYYLCEKEIINYLNKNPNAFNYQNESIDDD